MDEHFDTITYDDNWQSVTQPEYPVFSDNADAEENDRPPENKRRTKAPRTFLLLTVQLTACIVIAAAAITVKAVGGEPYEAVKGWYIEKLNDTAIFSEQSSLDLQRFFTFATPDEA